MPSRMEKYYGKSSENTKRRSNKNRELYSKIFTYGDYSNIEGVADLDKDEVNIDKVKELINRGDNPKVKREYRNRTIKENDYELPTTYSVPKENNYDLNDMLKVAKENRVPDDRERALHNTQYNILKNIDVNKELKKEDYIDDEDSDEIKEMIHTITSTSMLNKLNDVDLAEDMLSELQADDTKVGELDNVSEYIEKEKKDNNVPYDESFFTSSLKLDKSDFVDSKKEKKHNVGSIIVIIILVLLLAISAFILINNAIG